MSKELIITSSLPALREAKRINDTHFSKLWNSRYNAVNGLEGDLKVHVPREAITIVFSSDTEVLKQQAAELMEGAEDAEVIE